MRLPFPIAVAVLAAAPAFAWTNTVETRIAAKAIQLAPPDLALLVEKNRAAFERGLSDAAGSEGQESHIQYGTTRGRLHSTIEAEVRASIAIMRERRPIVMFVEHLGRLAHLVSDANNPFHASNADRRLACCKADFEAYQSRRIGTMPTVFYGLRIGNDLSSYVSGMLARSASLHPLLAEEYFRYGMQQSSADFDDRSTAYGVASISYSHSVSDLVNIYYYIWQKAGGDVRSAPSMRSGNLILDESTIGAYKLPSAGKANQE